MQKITKFIEILSYWNLQTKDVEKVENSIRNKNTFFQVCQNEEKSLTYIWTRHSILKFRNCEKSAKTNFFSLFECL